MRKIGTITTATILVVGIAGCGSSKHQAPAWETNAVACMRTYQCVAAIQKACETTPKNHNQEIFVTASCKFVKVRKARIEAPSAEASHTPEENKARHKSEARQREAAKVYGEAQNSSEEAKNAGGENSPRRIREKLEYENPGIGK
jgi:hypothetical protein